MIVRENVNDKFELLKSLMIIRENVNDKFEILLERLKNMSNLLIQRN